MVVPVLRKTGGSKPLPTHYVPAADTCLQWRMPVDVGLLGEKFPNCPTEPHYTARKVTLLRRVLATSSVAGSTPSLGIVQIKPKQANEKGTQY